MSNEVTLKPCAHCSRSDDELRESITDAQVSCYNCDARRGLVYFGSSEAANAHQRKLVATAWNQRSGDTTELLKAWRPWLVALSMQRGETGDEACDFVDQIDTHLGEA